MAIEWPSIAQGSGTGTTYTSPDNFTWIWNGRAWEGKGGSGRGYPQPWVVFATDGTAFTYQTLISAMLNTSSDDTIHLYGDVIEPPGVPISHNVEINFNGHTLTFDYSLSSNIGDYGIYFSDVTPYNVKMYNGTVKYINESSYPLINRPLIRSYGTGDNPCTYEFIGMNFITERNIAGFFIRSNVKGGNFYSSSTVEPTFAFDLTTGSTAYNYTVEDVYAESVGNTGVSVAYINTSIDSTFTFRNIVGVTKGNNASLNTNSGIRIGYQGASTGPGHVNVVDCMGINTTAYTSDSNAGILIDGGTGKPKNVIRVSNCFGSSVASIGIIASNCELTNCAADGARNFRLRNVNASGCADLRNGYDVLDESCLGSQISQIGDLILDNCAFSTGVYSYDNSSGTSLIHKVDIRNCTLYSVNNTHVVLSSPGTATKVKVNNNVVGFPGVNANPISVSGGTGSESTNNVLFGISGTNSAATAITGSTTPMYLRSNLFFGCSSSTHTNQSGTNITNQDNIVHPQ